MKKHAIFVLLFLLACPVLLANTNPTPPTTSDSLVFAEWRRPFTLQAQHFLMGKGRCDACGCSASGGSMGFGSMLNSNFVGLRYLYQDYRSRDGIFANSPWVRERFNTVQLWSRIPIGKNWQVSALLPYHDHSRQRATGKEQLSGMGDLTVLAMYTVYQTRKDSTLYTHKLQLGGGLKAPTGQYSTANNAGSVNPSFQLGTGSWDYLLAVEYGIKRNRIGFNTMLIYTIKTANSKDYRFGNQTNYGGTFFYRLELGKITLLPQAGLSGEIYESNHQYGQLVHDTSGDVLFGKYGLEAGFRKMAIGLNLMQPVSQNLTGGNVQARYRWGINLNYALD